ncbi:hypothetical protein NDU88_002876 [Pleurodeles waltl]|uniref:Uncharacterized protein n=1 Tax=Pleurodeles waltl TaxID=8319 RepID=A0AAV7UEF9_PLEWA|nr:hypothetical protein NDU88_002876 [Pleurodeles waltl]
MRPVCQSRRDVTPSCIAAGVTGAVTVLPARLLNDLEAGGESLTPVQVRQRLCPCSGSIRLERPPSPGVALGPTRAALPGGTDSLPSPRMSEPLRRAATLCSRGWRAGWSRAPHQSECGFAGAPAENTPGRCADDPLRTTPGPTNSQAERGKRHVKKKEKIESVEQDQRGT